MLVSLERHPLGPRLRVFHQRTHHGAVGCLLLAFRRTRWLGLVLCAHDLPDWREWFARGWQG